MTGEPRADEASSDEPTPKSLKLNTTERRDSSGIMSHGSERVHFARRVLLLLVGLAALSGCGQHDRREQPAELGRERDLARLRSLPYVGAINVPRDAPTGVVLLDKERVSSGYRLYTIQQLGRAELISEEGEVVRRWWYQPGDRWERSELLPNGDLLVVGMEGHGLQGDAKPRGGGILDSSRYVVRLDWHGKLVWKRMLLAHHDIEVTPSGKLLLLTFDRRMEPSIHPTVETRDAHMTLLDSTGTVVESRSLLESVRNSPEFFLMQRATPSRLGVRPWVDLFHANSIEWMHQSHLFSVDPIYGPNNVLVSLRHQDRVAIFDWQEREVVWSWGRNELSGPHDAQVLENGHILLFDNGLHRGWSRAIELDPLTGRIVWEYRATPEESFYTGSKGSAQRLPNGNTLLAESDRGRAIEVTPDGDVVWEFICPYGVREDTRAAIVRMVHHSPEFVERWLSGVSH